MKHDQNAQVKSLPQICFSWVLLSSRATDPTNNQPPTTYPSTHQPPTQRLAESLKN